MVHVLALAALPPFMAALHRLRGGGFVTLPFKLTYWLAIPVFAILWLAGAPWPVALAWGLGYEFWCLFAWMALLTCAVGAPVPAGQVMGSGLDNLCEALSFGDAVLACIVRAGLFLLPLVAALLCLDAFDGAGPLYDAAPLAIIVAVFLPAYLVGYRLRPTDMSSIAEPIVGLSWGLAMVGMLVLA